MPTVLRWEGHRAFFYSNEGNEPPHIHVVSNGREAKFWLYSLDVAVNFGFSEQEIARIKVVLDIHKLQLSKVWKEYFDE